MLDTVPPVAEPQAGHEAAWQPPAAEMVGSHMSLFTHANSIGVFGGLDAERSEQQNLWVWDLSGDQGFQQVHYK